MVELQQSHSNLLGMMDCSPQRGQLSLSGEIHISFSEVKCKIHFACINGFLNEVRNESKLIPDCLRHLRVYFSVPLRFIPSVVACKVPLRPQHRQRETESKGILENFFDCCSVVF